jgi:uncharacterized protein YecE (DUF72 family)
MTAAIRIGTASWTDHEPFYPPEYDKVSMKSRRIEYYAQYFSMVEVDSTFYHLQPAHNFELWAERTPDDFVFDVKAYGELTWHHREEDSTLEQLAERRGKARMMQSSRSCERIQLTCVSALSGWWRQVAPYEKPPGCLA